MDEPSPGGQEQEPSGLARSGISRASADALRNLNLRFDDCYLIGFMDGPRGTRWHAMPKDAPDEDITAESAVQLAEILVLDHGARQEARRKNTIAVSFRLTRSCCSPGTGSRSRGRPRSG